MAISARTRRGQPTASQRHLHAPRSRPVFWLIGGIGAAFAVVMAFILLGGPSTDDGLVERVEALESEAARLEEDRPEAAIKRYETLLSIAGGDRWRVKQTDWRARIKDLKAQIALIKDGQAKLAAWAKAVEAATVQTARPLLEEGHRLKEQWKRLWSHDALLGRLDELKPTRIPTASETREKIAAEFDLGKKGKARWGPALKAWKEYQALPTISESDRAAVPDAMNTIELRAREEVGALIKRAAAPEDLKAQRLRFEGTKAAVELEKAIQAP
jgi:hypothetical protein